MPNSFCLPPVEYCRGTTPTQAAKSRPRRKAAPLPMAATVAVETSGPKPGIWRRRRQSAFSLLMRSISSVIALMSISTCFHSCHMRWSSQRRRGLRFCSALSNLLLGQAAFRGRNREPFSESRMRGICHSGSMSGLCQEDEKSSCCTKDEGGPFGVALSGEASNCHKLLQPKAAVVNVTVRRRDEDHVL